MGVGGDENLRCSSIPGNVYIECLPCASDIHEKKLALIAHIQYEMNSAFILFYKMGKRK